MPLTPDEIERRRFAVTLRGYHTAEVDAFLRQIATELRERAATPMVPGVAASDGPAASSDMGVGPAFGRVANTIASLLQTAAESAADIRRDAEEHAAGTRSRAEEDGRLLRARAEREAADAMGVAQSELERASREAAEIVAAATAERERARAEAGRIVEDARREAAELRSRAQADHDRLAAIDRELRRQLEAAAEGLFRSLHRPALHDPMAVLSLPEEERRAAEPPVAQWAEAAEPGPPPS